MEDCGMVSDIHYKTLPPGIHGLIEYNGDRIYVIRLKKLVEDLSIGEKELEP